MIKKSSGDPQGLLKVCRECDRTLSIETFPSKGQGRRRATCRDCFKAVLVRRAERQRAAPDPDVASRWPSVDAFDATPPVDAAAPENDAEPVLGKLAEREAQRHARLERDRERRVASDFDALQAADFDLDDEYGTGVSNDTRPGAGALSAQAAQEKRQDFNARMAEFATDLRNAAVSTASSTGTIGDHMPQRHAKYIQALAEQERRFGNRRHARSIAIAEAHEQLAREGMIYVAETFFQNKIEPRGYARLPAPEKPATRTACLLLSDIHLGSELDSLDEPVSYRAVEEARRLEYVLRQFVDYKPQYRDNSTALVIINGDIIEGSLQHDLRSGAPLSEQKAVFWQYFSRFIAHVAECYRSVHVECQPGNHGRDKLRHPGRASASKWDGHEWSMYYALQMMCSGLRNVTWSIPHRAVGIVDLHGAKLGVTHADTELKLGDPDTKSRENAAALDKINATRIYGVEFAAWVFGHYHKGRYQPRRPRVLWNAALVPPNGHARGAGYIGEPCGQWIWEAVEGHPIGDVRFCEVGLSQDCDSRLGTLIPPFRFSMIEP